MSDTTIEKLERIANYLFGKWCEKYEDHTERQPYSDGVNIVQAILDTEKNERN